MGVIAKSTALEQIEEDNLQLIGPIYFGMGTIVCGGKLITS